LISDPCNAIGKQPFLTFFLLEEHLKSVPDIKDTKRFRISAEQWDVLKASCCHDFPVE